MILVCFRLFEFSMPLVQFNNLSDNWMKDESFTPHFYPNVYGIIVYCKLLFYSNVYSIIVYCKLFFFVLRHVQQPGTYYDR